MGGGGEGLRIEGLVPVEHVGHGLGHVQADHDVDHGLGHVETDLVKLNMAKSACYARLPTQLIIWISLFSQQLDHL